MFCIIHLSMLPRDLIQNFVPRVGYLIFMYFHRQYTKSNPLSSSPQNMGISGVFDRQFQPQDGKIDYWLGQIPGFLKKAIHGSLNSGWNLTFLKNTIRDSFSEVCNPQTVLLKNTIRDCFIWHCSTHPVTGYM